jgi:hypothetical protein
MESIAIVGTRYFEKSEQSSEENFYRISRFLKSGFWFRIGRRWKIRVITG